MTEQQATQGCFQRWVLQNTKQLIYKQIKGILLEFNKKLKSSLLYVRENVSFETSISLRKKDWEYLKKKKQAGQIEKEL